jgi:hypothetical protein
MALFLGAGISGAFGYGAYRSFNMFSLETAKTDAERKRLNNSIVPFNNRSKLGQSTGIVTFVPKKITFFDIYKEHVDHDLRLKHIYGYDITTGQQHIVTVPTVVNNIVQTHCKSFITDSSLGNPSILANVSPSYIFHKRSTILQCNGLHLTSYFREKYGMTIMMGNNNSFHINETILDGVPLYLFGNNVDDRFQYTSVSDDRMKLIEKEIMANDNSINYLYCGLFCLSGLVTSIAWTITEVSKNK